MHIKINFMDVFNNSIGSKIIVSKLKGYTKMCTPSFRFFIIPESQVIVKFWLGYMEEVIYILHKNILNIFGTIYKNEIEARQSMKKQKYDVTINL